MSSLPFIVFYSFLLFVATLAATSLPLLVHMSKNMSKVISLIGVGLMLGTGFIVVVPEAVLRGCECVSSDGAESASGGHLESKNIGLAIVIGFIVMMLADSLSHSGHEHDHDHSSANNDEHSDTDKQEVVINLSELSLSKLRSSMYGLCLHSFFDGLAVGSSVTAAHPEVLRTMFWAIMLHKMSASLGVGIFIRQLHVPFKQGGAFLLVSHIALRYMAVFSAVTPLSTVLSALLVQFSSSYIPASLLGYAFAFSAGTFVHVALMHILPSIGSHVGLMQVCFILLGVMIPYVLFSEHSH